MLFKNCFRDIKSFTSDFQLFTQILSCCNLTKVWKTELEDLNVPQTLVLNLFKSCLEDCFTVKDVEDYQKISPELFLKTMEKEMAIDLSTTYYLSLLLSTPIRSKTASLKRTNEMASSQLSTTPKKKIKDTSTSFTDAFTTPPSAAAPSTEDIKSKDDDLDSLLNSVQPQTYSSGTIGSTIFFKNQGKSYTWKSPEWTTATKYVDLKIYNNPNSLPEKKPMDQWKEASFRAKVLIGTPHSNADRTLKIHRTLETLKTLLIAEANTDPNCVAQVKE